MKSVVYIPESAKDAGAQIRHALAYPLDGLPKSSFIRAWSSIAYLFPGLHPDGYEDSDTSWPRILRRFAAEAWWRAAVGELNDAELYPSDAQWCGLCDQINHPSANESQRRRELAELSLKCTKA